MLRIVVLSDIHLGSLAAYREFAVNDCGLELDAEKAVSIKNDLFRILNDKKPDYVFIPGDLTTKALPSEFKKLSEILVELKEKTSSSPKIIFTAGNHDTQWNISKIAEVETATTHDKIELQEIAAIPLLRNFKVGCKLDDECAIPFTGFFEDDYLQVIVLNSGYFSSSDEKYHHGKIGEIQLDWLRSQFPLNKDKWRIILMHHHPYRLKFPTLTEDITFLEEGDEVIELAARSGIDIIIHGHRHHPIIRTKNDNTWNNPITILCSGSLSVNSKHRAAGTIPNTFHIIELDEMKSVNKIFRTLNYEFAAHKGWVLSEYCDSTPYDGISYYGESIDKEDSKRQLLEIIKKAEESRNSDIYFELPSYEVLPLVLKCNTYDQLNILIEEIATELGKKKTGCYPEDVIIRG